MILKESIGGGFVEHFKAYKSHGVVVGVEVRVGVAVGVGVGVWVAVM